MLISERELNRMVELEGAKKAELSICESLRKKEIAPEDVSIRGVFENFVVDLNGKPIGRHIIDTKFQENLATAVSASGFSNITGQIFYNALIPKYELANFNVANQFMTVQSQLIGVNEKIAGIGNIGDLAKEIGEYEEIPMCTVNEDWITAPLQRKSGLRIPISREAIISDRTGVLLMRCRQLGEAMGLHREKEAVSTLVNGQGASARTAYTWRGTAYATYSATNWNNHTNLVTSNPLVDHTSINNAYVALSNQVDPLTGEPLADVNDYVLITTPSLAYTAQRIARSVELQTGTASSSNVRVKTDGFPPVPFTVIVSKYLPQELSAQSLDAGTWFFGSVSKSFGWLRSLDTTVEEALPNSGLMFSNDIVQQYRVLKFETSFTMNPRFMTKNVP